MLDYYRMVFKTARQAQQKITSAGLHEVIPFAGLQVRLAHRCGAPGDYRYTDFGVWKDLREPLICSHCKERIDE